MYLQVNPIHLQFLNPLRQWKIMTVEALYAQSNYKGTYKAFHKILKRLERVGVTQGFRDMWSRKKFIYLTELGSELIFGSDQLVPFNNAIFHDARVAMIGEALLQQSCFFQLRLEHEYRLRQVDKAYGQQYFPDAMISYDEGLNEEPRTLGIEVELSQKSKDRIRTKLGVASSAKDLNHVIFLFSEKSIYQAYVRLWCEVFEKNRGNSVLFFCDEGIISGRINLASARGHYNGKEYIFGELFYKRGDLATTERRRQGA